jgi:hypothetical protein
MLLLLSNLITVFINPQKIFPFQQIPSLKTKAIIMANRAGGKIMDQATINAIIVQGEASRKACKEAIKRYYKEEEERKKEEDIKKLSEDTGTTSRTKYSKGI